MQAPLGSGHGLSVFGTFLNDQTPEVEWSRARASLTLYVHSNRPILRLRLPALHLSNTRQFCTLLFIRAGTIHDSLNRESIQNPNLGAILNQNLNSFSQIFLGCLLKS